MAKKKIIKHLKGDIETFEHEAAEDRKLIKSLKSVKAKKKKKASKDVKLKVKKLKPYKKKK